MPAKVFFEIRDTQNYQLMRPRNGVGTAELQPVYLEIYDKYFIESDNPNANRYLEISNRLIYLTYKKTALTAFFKMIWDTPAQIWDDIDVIQMRHAQIEELNKHLEEPINLDNDIVDELSRCVNVELGILKDEIQYCESEMDDLRRDTGNNVFNFMDSIVGMENVYGRTLDEEMMLPKYVALEKAAIKKANAQKQQANGKR